MQQNPRLANTTFKRGFENLVAYRFELLFQFRPRREKIEERDEK